MSRHFTDKENEIKKDTSFTLQGEELLKAIKMYLVYTGKVLPTGKESTSVSRAGKDMFCKENSITLTVTETFKITSVEKIEPVQED